MDFIKHQSSRIDVAIVNHNTCEHLRALLGTIEPEAVRELVVVDNASTDGSAAMVKGEYPWVALHVNQANPGYGAAANQAIASSQAQYVLLLNSDTRLQPGTLQALSSYLDQHPKAAIAGPRLINPDGSLQPSCYPFPTPLHVFMQESTLGRIVGAVPVLRDHYLRTWPHQQARIVPWLLGAVLAIRREAFLEVGGFDESFFMWVEEVDLCYRLQAAGWQTHFTPSATVMHTGGASTQQQRADMAVQFFLSMAHFYRKHYSRERLNQLIVIMKSIVLARLLRDQVRYHLPFEGPRRARIEEDITAWRRILIDRGERRGVMEEVQCSKDG